MTKIATAIVLLLSLALGVLWYHRQHGKVEAPAGISTGRNGSSNSDSKTAAQVLALETLRDRRNKTVWATELLAQKHEEVFIKLWDELRIQANAFAVLTNFPFGSLRLGQLTQPTRSDHGISIQRLEASSDTHSLESWRRLLDRWKDEGWQLEQSEWRHARFTVAANGSTESSFFIALHARNGATEERRIVRGEIQVKWRNADGPNAIPFPERIDASDLEMLSRQGKPLFDHVIAADLAPEKIESKSLEPSLQLYDLDGDGLSEVIVAARNRVFWNRGGGVFAPDRLLAYPLPAPGAFLFADFDGDAWCDLLAADAQGLALYAGDSKGRFLKPAKRIRFTEHELENPSVMTAGDIDGDGDLDVWLAQYKVPYRGGQVPTPYYDAKDGFPAFLLMNDGQGSFSDETKARGLAEKRFRRTYSSSFVDLDDDRDLDLVVVSDFAGTDVYFNDGRAHFTDVTDRNLDEAHGFGMAHAFGDFDRDGHLDLFVIGMNSFVANRLDGFKASELGFPEIARMRPAMSHGNRLYYWRDGVFKQTPASRQVARSGWSWGVTAGDFDNDGDLDFYVGNGHISGRSAKDYEPEFWLHDIYAGNSTDNPALDQYFRSVQARYQGAGLSYGGFEKNRLYLNTAGEAFLEAGYLMGVAMEEDCRNVVSDDLDGDGKLDLLVVTFQTWPKIWQALHLFPNFTSDAGHWIGIRLREFGPGFSPVGAKVILTTSRGKQIRQFVTGDSYRSQHAPTAHFGLGGETEVRSIEVVWPNGRTVRKLNPAIDRYHRISPESLL